jgi:phosphoribosylformylglycinamidine cyclo-ligase
MPGLYLPGHYVLGGAIVGVVSRSRFVDGSTITPGDALVGLGSSGLHTNGYSLARRALFETGAFKPEDRPDDLGETLADSLLRPHRSYLKSLRILDAGGSLKGAAHITGGGIPGNLSRILKGSVDARVDRNWPIPPVFRIIARAGSVEEAEMFRTFNMGIGLIAVVPAAALTGALAALTAAGEAAYPIGEIVPGQGRVVLS